MCSQADHDAIKADPARFRSLTPLESQHLRATPTKPARVLELRNCVCGSTLGLIYEDKQP